MASWRHPRSQQARDGQLAARIDRRGLSVSEGRWRSGGKCYHQTLPLLNRCPGFIDVQARSQTCSPQATSTLRVRTVRASRRPLWNQSSNRYARRWRLLCHLVLCPKPTIPANGAIARVQLMETSLRNGLGSRLRSTERSKISASFCRTCTDRNGCNSIRAWSPLSPILLAPYMDGEIDRLGEGRNPIVARNQRVVFCEALRATIEHLPACRRGKWGVHKFVRTKSSKRSKQYRHTA